MSTTASPLMRSKLYAEVLSAVAATDRPLTAAELDEALGIHSS